MGAIVFIDQNYRPNLLCESPKLDNFKRRGEYIISGHIRGNWPLNIVFSMKFGFLFKGVDDGKKFWGMNLKNTIVL